MNLYLSHIRLSRSPSARALAPLFRPGDVGLRRSAQHSLLWSVFADDQDRKRDFLWREERDGSFLVLSARQPRESEIFLPHQVKPFAPVLAAGDQLEFLLRVNATRTRRDGGRVDVVMDEIHRQNVRPGSRAERRMELAREAGAEWLSRQGSTAGFEPLDVQLQDYSVETLPARDGDRGRPHFGILDLAGRLEVTDPDRLVERIARGFGRAKAFGCGLMLIRRPRN